MSRFFALFVLLCPLIFSGCFRHREAPHRPVSADSVRTALALKDSVERVVLTDVEIGDLPAELAGMPELTTLLLRGAAVGDMGVLPSIAGLRTLDISATSNGMLPSAVTACNGLKRLYCADNEMKQLSADIGRLTQLEYLNLDRNELAVLPEEIGACVGMRWLRLNSNKLEVLPDGIAAMSQLQRIYLKNNRFNAVPEVLRNLTLLEDIDLSGNPVTELPGWLFELPRLRQLNLDNCRIAALPPDLKVPEGLQVLSLTRCTLSSEDKKRLRKLFSGVHIAF